MMYQKHLWESSEKDSQGLLKRVWTSPSLVNIGANPDFMRT